MSLHFLTKLGSHLSLRMYKNRDKAPCHEWSNLIDLGIQYNDKSYSDQMSRISIKLMTRRLTELGFVNLNNVLDLGCGYGQWTRVLSSLNKNAYGIDMNENRIEISKNLFKNEISVSNLYFSQQNATKTSFPDEHFDAIFCYGVFMFLNPSESLSEIKRILKPEGLLYVATNSSGWWVYLIIKNFFKNFYLTKVSIKALVKRQNTLPSSLSKRIYIEYSIGMVL